MRKVASVFVLAFVASCVCAADGAPDKARALEGIKASVAEALKSGKKVEVWLTLLGSPQKVEILRSDAKFLTIKLQNNPFPHSWDKISPEQLAGVGKACVLNDGKRALALADYCIATEQKGKADEALVLAASLDKNLSAQIAERMAQVKSMNGPAISAIAASGVGPKAPPPPREPPPMATPMATKRPGGRMAEPEKKEGPERVMFGVIGLETGVPPVTAAFKKIEGVQECYGNIENGMVTMVFDPKIASLEKIQEAFNTAMGPKIKALKPGEPLPEPEYVYTDKEETLRGTMAVRLPESASDVVCRLMAQRAGEPRTRLFNLLGTGEMATLIEETRKKGAEVTVVGIVTKDGIKVSKISE
ncbi:MAG TPA: hypothetical protein VEK08_14690 [Planctomycetota bacterium]|nr:hypothetical protein [Planctomycetota bacterium]